MHLNGESLTRSLRELKNSIVSLCRISLSNIYRNHVISEVLKFPSAENVKAFSYTLDWNFTHYEMVANNKRYEKYVNKKELN